MKPIRDLKVTFQGQSYTIKDGVSTVGELTDKFQEVSGLASDEFGTGIVWKGKVLVEKGQDLSNLGVQNGDCVMILPGSAKGNTKDLDALGVFTFLFTSDDKNFDMILQKLNEANDDGALNEMWSDISEKIRTLTRREVADALRERCDLAYHQLRAWWENPIFRQVLHDPARIEKYRQVVSSNFAPKMLKKSPGRLQRAIKSPEVWLKEFQRITSAAIRLGDVIMDGILDLLLNVLKQGNSASMYSSQALRNEQDYNNGGGGPSTGSPGTSSDPRMDDPSFANNLLFELSESEDE